MTFFFTETKIEKSLITIMSKFKLDDFETLVMPYFPEIEWKKVKNGLVANNLRLTPRNAAKLMQSFIQVNILYSV